MCYTCLLLPLLPLCSPSREEKGPEKRGDEMISNKFREEKSYVINGRLLLLLLLLVLLVGSALTDARIVF